MPRTWRAAPVRSAESTSASGWLRIAADQEVEIVFARLARNHQVSSSQSFGLPTASHRGRYRSLKPIHVESAGSTSDQPISSNLRSPLRRLQPQHAVTKLDISKGSPPPAMGTM
jgi:hypothetical protein